MLVVVHPNFGCSSGVLGKNVATAAGECVWMPFSEHMTHSTTWYYFQAATTLPYSKWYLQIFASYIKRQNLGMSVKIRFIWAKNIDYSNKIRLLHSEYENLSLKLFFFVIWIRCYFFILWIFDQNTSCKEKWLLL